ncbi:uncharacterized protein LOC111700661 [Eurytemora carolleeae]|uniref:uncharacterized protein LOC111700661 n=1 Tax=Eurytemora carolleeae TaxID=1294199 RepID=UPI000C763279|nr:uncharacterized protein LOC111700661 [Eurytemora carolleeae]|eukprot:XP_023327414.1 uncharacterized protein LOC111700661 [Eurytemora affinis]
MIFRAIVVCTAGSLVMPTGAYKLKSEGENTGNDIEDNDSIDPMDLDKGRAFSDFREIAALARDTGTPCCHRIGLEAEENHGIWMIHFNKLGTYTITNTLVGGRNTWISDTDPDFVITWCGTFWHVGHKEQAGECNGYISSPNDALCFDGVRDLRYYVHCINEWVDAGPSKLRIRCAQKIRVYKKVQL